MRTFKIRKDPYDDRKIYNKTIFKINPGVTILVGCNGSGKTTLLRYIEDQIKALNRKIEDKSLRIPVFKYNNYTQGGNFALQRALDTNNMDLLAASAFASEGERILTNFGQTIKGLGSFVTKHKDTKEMWILFDAVESGLSIDNIREIKGFFKFLLNEQKQKELYILVSTNSYEFCIDEPCFDVQNAKYIDINSYEDYANFVMKSREYKDKSYDELEEDKDEEE